MEGIEAVSFDLFDTLLRAERPPDPGQAIAQALSDRGINVPAEWTQLYTESHFQWEQGEELSLVDHVRAALAEGGVTADSVVGNTRNDPVEAAVLAAFDRPVETRRHANAAVSSVSNDCRVGILSNCSVPGLVKRVLERSTLSTDSLDAVVTSVGCGYRKPDLRSFRAVADELGVSCKRLGHVGDDRAADGGATRAGAHPLLLADTDLETIAREGRHAWE